MILSALGQARTVLVLSLSVKDLIPFRESISHINTSYNPYPSNVGHYNSNGRIIKAISQISPACSPNFSEALVALLATSLAVSLNLKNICIEGDSLLVVSALQHPTLSHDWQIDKVISNFFFLLVPASSS